LGVEARSVLPAIMRLKAAGLLDEEHRLEVGTLPRLGSQLPAVK